MLNRDLFVDCWENAELPVKVALWNEYARLESTDNEVFYNDEDFFDTMSPMEAVRTTYYGSYNFMDTYVWFDGYANLSSSNDIDDMPVDFDALFDFLQENPDILKQYTDFNELFCDDPEDDDE